MITTNITVENEEEVKKLFENFNADFLAEFLSRVKQKTPVRTGFLQSSWGGNEQPTKIEVFNGAPYAEYIENGTERIAPVGMLKTTIQEAPAICQEITRNKS